MDQNQGENQVNETVTSAPVVESAPVQPAPVEKKKSTVIVTIVVAIIFLLVGLVSGVYTVKALNTNVKNNSFMYDVLKNMGLLTVSEIDDEDYATDNDIPYATSNNAVVNDGTKMTYVGKKGNIDYFVTTDEKGVNYYYYKVDDWNVYYYYATDADGHHMKEYYMDKPQKKSYTIQNYVGKKYSDIDWDEYWHLNVLYVPTSDPEVAEGAIYYQSEKPGSYEAYFSEYENKYSYKEVVLLVNSER